MHYLTFNLGVIHIPEYLQLQGELLYEPEECILPNVCEIESHNKQWAINLKLCNEQSKLLHAGLAQGAAYAFRNASVENLKLYTDYTFLFLIIDDILDEAWQSIHSRQILANIFTAFIECLKGIPTELDNNQYEYIFPKFKAICDAFYDLHKRLIIKKEPLKYFINSVQELFNIYLQEFTHRFNKQQPKLVDYINIRMIAGGPDTFCELVYLLQGIKINEKTRHNPLLLKLKEHAYKALVIANDILSLSKEIKYKDNTTNYILLLREKNKSTLQEAFTICLEHYNDEMKQFLKIKKSLLTEIHNPNLDQHQELTYMIAIISNHIGAHLQWALATDRYKLEYK